MRDDLSPGVWDITRTRGDGFTPVGFEIEVDAAPMAVAGAVAQVRQRRDRSSTLLFTPSVSVSGATVTVGAFESLEPLTAGTWFWDLQVWDGTDWKQGSPLTVVAGVFRVVEDVTHV